MGSARDWMKVWVMVVVMGLIAPRPAVGGTMYRSTDGQWTLTIPDGWKSATKQMTSELAEASKKFASGVMDPSKLRFDLMIIPEKPDGSFAIVQIGPSERPGVTFGEMCRGWKLGVKSGLESAAAKTGGLSIGDSTFDEPHKRMSIGVDFSAAGKPGVHMDTTTWFGAKESVTIHAYSPQGSIDEHRAVFGGLVDSFSFTPGNEYDYNAGLSRKAEAWGGLAVPIIVLGIALVGWIVRRVTR